jgi:hypothetical protein
MKWVVSVRWDTLHSQCKECAAGLGCAQPWALCRLVTSCKTPPS